MINAYQFAAGLGTGLFIGIIFGFLIVLSSFLPKKEK